MPPENCADYAFLLHMLKSMDPANGRGAIILPHGVLFRGGQEEVIRKKLLKSGLIEGIIGLPSNLFYGTGIPACIIILDKKGATTRKNIFMIDASKYFVKDGNKNKLREEDIKKITDTYLDRIEEEKYSRIVTIEEIEKEEYNLNIPRYIDSSEEERIQDIRAHLLGGIPEINIEKLSKYWKVAPNLKNKLFKKNEKRGYLDLAIDKEEINEKISNSKEFMEYFEKLIEKVVKWETENKDKLYKVSNKTRVKDLIEELSNSMLKIFKDDKIIDKYEAYEFLMEYYNNTLKDDLHLIVENGWIPKLVFGQDKNGKIKKSEFESDLLPKEIIIKEYFKEYAEKSEKLNNELNFLIQELENRVEENTGDEAIFYDAEKVNEKLIKEKIKEELEENVIILKEMLENISKQKEVKKNIKETQEELNELVIKKYESLDEKTSKYLIIHKKWFKDVENRFGDKYIDIIYDLSIQITNEIKNYENTLGKIVKETSNLESLVLKDLERMGYTC